MALPTVPLPPLRFLPVLMEKPWGGDGLYRVLGKGLPSDTRMGESWELSDREEAPSIVADGRFAGQSLCDLFQRHAPAILGLQWSPEVKRFPLLYKFIYAREKLSVQVHPGADSPEGEPKTECWTLLEAPERGSLILGLRPGDRGADGLLAALQGPECEKVLNRVPCAPGDVFFIPAGTVHAITEGLLLYEVQQNSDTTYRLYDWGRVDDQGRPRALHVKEAAEVMDASGTAQGAVPPLRVEKPTHTEEFLVACPEFALVRLKEFTARVRLDIPRRFRVLSLVSGALMLHPDNGPSLRIERGETVLLPASLERIYLESPMPGTEAILSFVPEISEEVVGPLIAEGYSAQAINRLGGARGLFPSD